MNKLKELIIHFFVPTEKNNLRAKALHQDFLTFYLLIALVMVFLVKGRFGTFKNVLGYATDINIPTLYQRLNQERIKNGLPPLNYSDKLAQAAFNKAQNMFAQNYWAHYGPDGTTPWNFILAAGYQYQYAGENLAKNFLFTQNVVDAWMASPTHRENILRKEFTDEGFAVVNGVLNGEQTTLVVELLGSPTPTVTAPASSAARQLPSSTTQATRAATVLPKFANNQTLLLAQRQTQPKINLFNLSFNTTFIFLSLLLFVLATDFYFASRFNIIRFHSKNLAHFIFLFTIFLGLLLFLTKGVIL